MEKDVSKDKLPPRGIPLMAELTKSFGSYQFDLGKAEKAEEEGKAKLSALKKTTPDLDSQHRPQKHTIDPKKETLVNLAKAMGGPRFPNMTLKIGQESDPVDTFEPLLEQFLEEGGNINETASFQDYFGTDIGLSGWSLLTVASSVWVNAPKCMRLLLEKGANPLQRDSSGRHAVMEALATARHGHRGPLQVLTEEAGPVVTPEDIRAAKLCDVTEALIKYLRQGKMDITPAETRAAYYNVWKEGFQIHSKHYEPQEIHEHFWEMFLIPLDALLTHSTLPLPTDPAVISFEQWMNGHSKDSKILFISHRWLRPREAHPDDTQNSKLSAIQQLGLQYCAINQGLDTSKCFLWIDYVCIDQTVQKIKGCSIQALPFYVMLSDAFIWLEHEDYLTRAWCMLEILFGSAMSTKTAQFEFCKFSHGKLEACDSLMERCNPALGGVTDPNDMNFIRPLTYFAEDLYKWL